MLDNRQRRNILDTAKAADYQGSIIDLFNQASQGADISQLINPPQQEMLTAQTPQEQEVGLREQHAQGNTGASMEFPNVPPNAAFNTKGMKVPINITKFNDQGHLVQSFNNVPPGIESLPTGPEKGTIIETPSYKKGGYKQKYQSAGFKKKSTITNKKAPYAGYRPQSFRQAMDAGEGIPFDTEKEAADFAKGNWKLPKYPRPKR